MIFQCSLVSLGTKAQQLLTGMQSDDEGQQLTSVMEMCQVIVTRFFHVSISSAIYFFIYAGPVLVVFRLPFLLTAFGCPSILSLPFYSSIHSVVHFSVETF